MESHNHSDIISPKQYRFHSLICISGQYDLNNIVQMLKKTLFANITFAVNILEQRKTPHIITNILLEGNPEERHR